MTHRIVTVYGRVQGVGFRDRIVEIAREFAVSGTVRNVPGANALEIDVEGEPDVVERFLRAALEERPARLARIERVEASEAAPLGNRRGFRRL